MYVHAAILSPASATSPRGNIHISLRQTDVKPELYSPSYQYTGCINKTCRPFYLPSFLPSHSLWPRLYLYVSVSLYICLYVRLHVCGSLSLFWCPSHVYFYLLPFLDNYILVLIQYTLHLYCVRLLFAPTESPATVGHGLTTRAWPWMPQRTARTSSPSSQHVIFRISFNIYRCT